MIRKEVKWKIEDCLNEVGSWSRKADGHNERAKELIVRAKEMEAHAILMTVVRRVESWRVSGVVPKIQIVSSEDILRDYTPMSLDNFDVVEMEYEGAVVYVSTFDGEYNITFYFDTVAEAIEFSKKMRWTLDLKLANDEAARHEERARMLRGVKERHCDECGSTLGEHHRISRHDPALDAEDGYGDCIELHLCERCA